MKKTFYLFAILFGCITLSNAQVTFKPGFRAGLNISHFSKGDDSYYNDGFTSNRDFGSRTDFYVGFFGDLKLTKYYSLQPEINYSRQGSKYDYYDESFDMLRFCNFVKQNVSKKKIRRKIN